MLRAFYKNENQGNQLINLINQLPFLWRCRESNSGPKKLPKSFLHA
ncbi:MAG: hypothetical protein ACI9XO_001271 [Paraglaciecola sp.]|jgi:hypothetical protein